jgi:multidrug efflux pump subunit AcrA (membrane-fusion protein)
MRVILRLFAGCLFLGCLFTGCGKGEPAGVPSAIPAEETVYSVRTVQVEIRDIQEYLEAGGDVITETSVDIFPDIAGKLVRLHAGLGDFVQKGQIIASVDPSKPGLTYTLSPVRAPISGTILEVPGKIGATVGESSVIARAGQLGSIQVKALIPEKQTGRVLLGQKAGVSFEAYPGEIFSALISRLSPVVDPLSRTREIRLTFTQPVSRVSVGMFARIRIETVVRVGRALIPESAVSRGGQSVFVVGPDSRAEERMIGAGISLDGFIEVIQGLQAGEIIISEGHGLLSDGVKVRVLSEQRPAL